MNKIPPDQPGYKERVDFGEEIGYFVKDGVETPTTKGMIIYSNEGVHIVPVRP